MQNKGLNKHPIRIAIFASGGGSNARAICEYFTNYQTVEVSLLVSNRSTSGIFDLGKGLNIPAFLLKKEEVRNGAFLVDLMTTHEIDLIVLAGYLKHVPDSLVKTYPKRIVNIHPSLLPAFGGKGMYGLKVHEAVVAKGEPVSGMTIHYVNEVYDEGEIIFQANQEVDPAWTASDLQQAILHLEHTYYSKVIESICQTINPIDRESE